MISEGDEVVLTFGLDQHCIPVQIIGTNYSKTAKNQIKFINGLLLDLKTVDLAAQVLLAENYLHLT